MSTAKRTIDVDLRTDVDAEIPAEVPRVVALEIEYGDDSERTVHLNHGPEEWTFEFVGGRCTDRDPPTRPVPQWINEALRAVKAEVR